MKHITPLSALKPSTLSHSLLLLLYTLLLNLPMWACGTDESHLSTSEEPSLNPVPPSTALFCQLDASSSSSSTASSSSPSTASRALEIETKDALYFQACFNFVPCKQTSKNLYEALGSSFTEAEIEDARVNTFSCGV